MTKDFTDWSFYKLNFYWMISKLFLQHLVVQRWNWARVKCINRVRNVLLTHYYVTGTSSKSQIIPKIRKDNAFCQLWTLYLFWLYFILYEFLISTGHRCYGTKKGNNFQCIWMWFFETLKNERRKIVKNTVIRRLWCLISLDNFI